jgi:glycosyltransferase involved in cell wall biosynthesis
MKKLLFTSLNDHVSWGGSEELWSKTALFLSEAYDVSILVKKWNPEAKQIKALRDNEVNIIYKNPNDLKSKSFLQKGKDVIKLLLKKKIVSIDYNDYDHVFISVGNHLDVKLIDLAEHLTSKKVDYSIIVQLATDLRLVNDTTIKRFTDVYLNAAKVFYLSEDNIYKTELTLAEELSNKEKINNPFYYNQSYTALSTDKFNLACVAAFISFHKAQDVLISVLNQEKWKQRAIKLNLYGDGINANQIKKLIQKYHLENHVEIKGYVQNKEDIWKENMVCIMPSRMEGQSLAMLEAMSHGRMVIATDVGDSVNLIKENETGFLIEAATFKHIDEALEKAWNVKEKWVDYGLNSRQHLYHYIKQDPVVEFANKIKKLV